VAAARSLLTTWESNIRRSPTVIQKRRKGIGLKKSLSKPGEEAVALSKSNGRWVEAIVEKTPEPQGLESSLRIYFTAGAYCQISNAREAGLAAELIGHLGVRKC